MATKKKARRAVWLIIAVLVVLGALAGVVPKVMTWSRSHAYAYTTDTVPQRDVTLVLGAMMWGNSPSPYLQARVDLAAALYKAGKTKVIIASGSSTPGDNEPEGMRVALMQAGVPANRIVLDFGGLDTYASCMRARDVYGVTALTVISQSYHLPRAVATCRALGIDAVGVGDNTQEHNFLWYKYQAREVLADAKMVLDLATNRQIADATPSDEVQKALNS